MHTRNALYPGGSGQKYKRWCLGLGRSISRLLSWLFPPVTDLPPPPGLDAVTTEAYLRSQELLRAPDGVQRMADSMALLRKLFREGGPLAALRWSWEELVPPVERHIFRVMEEVEDMSERRARLFERCAPELLDPGRLARMDEVLRRELMSPERTLEERRALAVAVMDLKAALRTAPYVRASSIVAWLMMEQVDEWVERRQRAQRIMDRALGREPGAHGQREMNARTLRRVLEEPEVMREAERDVVAADPELVEILARFETALLQGILLGRTPQVLHGEEWLWMTVVLREPLRLEVLEQGGEVDVEALLGWLDEEVKQAVLSRVEAASRDRSSPPEAEQWFGWAYMVLRTRPLAFFGAFAKAREMWLRERFDGEADLVHALQGRERWSAEDLEPYRLRLAAFGAHGAEQRVRRLQALLRGERPGDKGRTSRM